MKHWHWISLAFLAVGLAVVAAAVPRLSGGTEQAGAQQGITVSLDMDTTGGPCADIDDSASHGTGDSYDVAICVAGLFEDFPIGVLAFDVIYDDTLNTAPEVTDAGQGLDDNPNLNENEYGDGVGSGWDCSGGGSAYPKGDKDAATGPGNGDAFLSCRSTLGPWTLGDNETSGVIAVVHFTADYEGTDGLVIANGLLGYQDASEMGTCNPGVGVPMTCVGGTDDKSGTPQPTSTATPTPTATSTPCPPEGCPTQEPTRRAWTKTPTPEPTGTPTPEAPAGEGEQPPPPPPPPAGEQMPQVMPPGTGSGPAEGMTWLTGLLWLMAGAGAVSVALGGLLGYGRGRSR